MVITPGAILEAVAMIRPMRKMIREARNRRRARLGKELLPPLTEVPVVELNTGGRTSTNSGVAGLLPVILAAPAADAVVGLVENYLPGLLGPQATTHIAAGITWVTMWFTARISKTKNDNSLL